MLKQVLRDQIRIAEALEQSEGRYSRDAAYAWDVVEEVSRKLNIVQTHIEDALEDERGVERAVRDEEISHREYDL